VRPGKLYARRVCGYGNADGLCPLLGCDHAGTFCKLVDDDFAPAIRAREDVTSLIPNCAWIRMSGDESVGTSAILQFNVMRLGVYVVLVYMVLMFMAASVAPFIFIR
jgi:hypothetical protein